jgi:hypothetical protein
MRSSGGDRIVTTRAHHLAHVAITIRERKRDSVGPEHGEGILPPLQHHAGPRCSGAAECCREEDHESSDHDSLDGS